MKIFVALIIIFSSLNTYAQKITSTDQLAKIPATQLDIVISKLNTLSIALHLRTIDKPKIEQGFLRFYPNTGKKITVEAVGLAEISDMTQAKCKENLLTLSNDLISEKTMLLVGLDNFKLDADNLFVYKGILLAIDNNELSITCYN